MVPVSIYSDHVFTSEPDPSCQWNRIVISVERSEWKDLDAHGILSRNRKLWLISVTSVKGLSLSLGFYKAYRAEWSLVSSLVKPQSTQDHHIPVRNARIVKFLQNTRYDSKIEGTWMETKLHPRSAISENNSCFQKPPDKCLYMYMFKEVCTCSCVGMHVEARWQPWVLCLRYYPPCFCEAGSFNGLELSWVGYAGWPLNPSHQSVLPVLGLQVYTTDTAHRWYSLGFIFSAS